MLARRRQRGQALILVLVFVAALLLVTWAALSLASGAFLAQSSIDADTRSTYALDAGVPYYVAWAKARNITGCNNFTVPSPLTLSYPTSSVTVTISNVTAGPGCSHGNPVLDFKVSASSTTRVLKAEVSNNQNGSCQNCQGNQGNGWAINWEQFQ